MKREKTSMIAGNISPIAVKLPPGHGYGGCTMETGLHKI